MQPDAPGPRALIHLNDEAGVDQFSVELESAIGNWLDSFPTREAAERYIRKCRLAHSPATDFRDTRPGRPRFNLKQ
jgi:hypothetical protein